MKAFHAIVTGTVQGVGFRYFTKLEADNCEIFGTVRNMSNGNVEVIFEGSERNVIQFLDWLHKGPDSAYVISMEYKDVEVVGYKSFEIIRSLGQL